MPRSPYAHGSWPRIRLAVLERDGWICQIRGKHCLIRASEADHIIPISQGGAWLDPNNLRAACKPCNTGRVGHQHSRRWQGARTYITVVVGQDASHYVQTHSQPNDLIVDTHTLTRTTGDPQAAASMWTHLVNQLRLGLIQNARAWITTTGDASSLPAHRVIKAGDAASGDAAPAHDATHTHLMAAATAKPSRIW